MAERKNTLINYTTEIEVEKTVKEIIELLFDKGASNISIDKDGAGVPKAVRFSFPFPGIQTQFITYRIDANWQGALQAMNKKSDIAPRFCTEKQARRTTWRTILYWIQMQIGMSEMMQGQIEQMFFSHAINADSDNFVCLELLEFKQKQLMTNLD